MDAFVKIHRTTIERLISVITDIIEDHDGEIKDELETLVGELNDILEEKEKYSLIGVDGNAYNVMAYVKRAMIECGKSKEDVKKYMDDAMSSDYNHLICSSQDMIDSLNKSC